MFRLKVSRAENESSNGDNGVGERLPGTNCNLEKSVLRVSWRTIVAKTREEKRKVREKEGRGEAREQKYIKTGLN